MPGGAADPHMGTENEPTPSTSHPEAQSPEATGATFPETPSDPLRLALELVEQLKQSEPVDPDRVYVTGLSMGGYIGWQFWKHHRHRLDALIAPTRGPAWMTDHVNGDQSSGISSSSLAAISGYASITVPAGYVVGLPIGVSFIGGAFSDAKLIRLAYAFEQASQARTPPFVD